MSEIVRVLVADDHERVRDSLILFLEAFDDLEYVGQARDGREALRQCQALRPDVILLDLVMPGMSGLQTLRRIRRDCPRVQVVALVNFYQQSLRQRALQAQAFAAVRKDAPLDKLAEILRLAGRANINTLPLKFLPK